MGALAGLLVAVFTLVAMLGAALFANALGTLVVAVAAMVLVGLLGILSEKLVYRPTLKVGHHVNAFFFVSS
jgi:hypothetical protein